MVNKNSIVCVIVFAILLAFQTRAYGNQYVDVSYKTQTDGTMAIDLSIKDPRIKGVIVKVVIPEDRRLISSRPRVRHSKNGILKWFIDVGNRNFIHIEAKLDRAVKEREIEVQAMFKVPGRPGLVTVKAVH